jgi:hypothetical protein
MRSEPASPALPVEAFAGRAAPALPAPVGAPEVRSSAPAHQPEAPPAILEDPEQLARLASTEDPALAVQTLLDDMSDAELRSTLSELTNLDAGDLAGIRNVREYSERLAAIAMKGVITAPEPEPEGQSAPVSEVTFSSAVDEYGAPVAVAERFDGTPRDRIYAHFPTERYSGDRVLVKWFREGQPRLLVQEMLGPPRMLLFGRYRVNRGDSISYVWLARERAWEPGRYRVELYDPSEPLEKLAAGRFEIAKEPPPASEPEPG